MFSLKTKFSENKNGQLAIRLLGKEELVVKFDKAGVVSNLGHSKIAVFPNCADKMVRGWLWEDAKRRAERGFASC